MQTISYFCRQINKTKKKVIMKKLMSLALLALMAVAAKAQVEFASDLVTNGTSEAQIVFTGKIAPGWHVYSTELGADGPIQASLNVNSLDGVELVGKLTHEGDEIEKHDNLFDMDLRYFENSVKFIQKVRFTKKDYKIDAYLEYGACNDQNCLPPAQVEIQKQGIAPAVASAGKAAAKKAVKGKSTNKTKGAAKKPGKASAKK